MKWLGKALSLCWAAALAAAPVAADEGCVTAACHPGMMQAKFAHAPVADGACGDCHLASGKAHPGAKGAFTLAEKGAVLCIICHDDPRQGQKIPHAPAAEGDCTACHDPHGSAVGKLLKGEGAALCNGCHRDPAVGKEFVHTPVRDGNCTGCHDPHKGERKGLLAEVGAKLCKKCHAAEKPVGYRLHGPVAGGQCTLCHEAHAGEAPGNLRSAGGGVCFPCHRGIQRQIQESAFQHAPVAVGACGDCHAPHGSPNRPNLNAAYPRELYTSFDVEKYALCFRCHDKGLAFYHRTSHYTAFRNGDSNLHYLHINREKGRVCKVCHGVHGADQPKIVKSQSSFGNWKIPIEMTFNPNGGTCYVGCHNPKTYDRMRAFKNP